MVVRLQSTRISGSTCRLSRDNLGSMNHPRECHTGWDTLIDELEEHLHYLSPAYVTHQIKEKFGTLRYYAEYVPSADDEPYHHRTETAKRMFHRLIDETERRSAYHCERCGEPGVLRKHLMWYKTLCDQCAPENSEEVEREEPVEDTLTLLADLMDQDAIHVDVMPSLLREAADTIKALREDTIDITSTDGEHIATIDGPLATETIRLAVTEWVRTSIREAIERGGYV